MSDNLYKSTMAYTGEVPWHRLGKQFDLPMTSEQVLAESGLGFEVYKEQLYRVTDSNIAKVNAFATINKDTNDVLGIVGKNYQPIQNKDCFGFFDELIGRGEAIYETAGALGKGERVWLLAKLPVSFSPIAGDKIEGYTLLYNSHDGTSPLSVMFTPIRVVCQNTLNLALKRSTEIVKVRHTTNAAERVEEAGKIIKQLNDYFTEMGEQCHNLAEYQIDDEFIESYKSALFGKEDDLPIKGPGRTVRNKKVAMFDQRLRFGKGVELPGVVGSAWHVVNAAIEMADFDLPKIDKDPTNTIIFGQSALFKQKSWDTAFALIGARK